VTDVARDPLDRVDLLALRLLVARDQTRLRPNTGLEVRVITGQLAELALAGVLVDHEGHPAIVSGGPVAKGALDPLRERINELSGWRWDQLFWRQGIYAKAVLEYATAELVDSGVWVRTVRARPMRPARYADLASDQLREVATQLDEVITATAIGTARERILVALNALLFNRRERVAWMDVDWTEDLEDLPISERATIQAIIEAANLISAEMRGGGSKDPVVSSGF
jgi:hypothetical protein